MVSSISSFANKAFAEITSYHSGHHCCSLQAKTFEPLFVEGGWVILLNTFLLEYGWLAGCMEGRMDKWGDDQVDGWSRI